ncbi:MAG: BON domain-containing protein [Planctomycetaceae bacterium]
MSDHRLDIPHALSQLPVHLERALKSLAAVGQRRIRAEVEGDAVVLKGVVRSYYHKQLAQETIRAVDGVRTIRNDIIVAPNLLSANRSPVSF